MHKVKYIFKANIWHVGKQAYLLSKELDNTLIISERSLNTKTRNGGMQLALSNGYVNLYKWVELGYVM